MKITPSCRWTARRAGGLFFGLRYDFVMSLRGVDTFPVLHWKLSTLSIGFIFFQINLDFEWGHHTEDDGC